MEQNRAIVEQMLIDLFNKYGSDAVMESLANIARRRASTEHLGNELFWRELEIAINRVQIKTRIFIAKMNGDL